MKNENNPFIDVSFSVTDGLKNENLKDKKYLREQARQKFAIQKGEQGETIHFAGVLSGVLNKYTELTEEGFTLDPIDSIQIFDYVQENNKKLTLDEQRILLKEILSMTKVDNKKLAAECACQLGLSFAINKNFEEAFFYFNEAKNLAPYLPMIYYNLSCYYCDLKDIDKAFENMKYLIEILEKEKDPVLLSNISSMIQEDVTLIPLLQNIEKKEFIYKKLLAMIPSNLNSDDSADKEYKRAKNILKFFASILIFVGSIFYFSFLSDFIFKAQIHTTTINEFVYGGPFGYHEGGK